MFCWSHKLPQQFAVLEADVSEEKIVEIDESKLGKCKYNKGKKVKGQWVFGGVKRESDKMFLISYGTIKELYNTYFLEYMWRRHFIKDNYDAFNKLVEHIVLYSKNLEE
ncbi:5972_t:CDS:2, partial [Cetraspora pellucida]